MDTLTAHSQHQEVSMTDRLSVRVGVYVCVCVCVFNPMTTKLLCKNITRDEYLLLLHYPSH